MRASVSLRKASFWKNGRVIGVSMKVGASVLTADLVRRELDRHRLGEARHRVLGGGNRPCGSGRRHGPFARTC